MVHTSVAARLLETEALPASHTAGTHGIPIEEYQALRPLPRLCLQHDGCITRMYMQQTWMHVVHVANLDDLIMPQQN